MKKPIDSTEKRTQSNNEKLEDIITSFVKYGKPSISYLTGSKSGWYCRIEMNTSSMGVDFKIASDFDHDTPISAAKQCRERLLKAISVYKE